MDGLGIFDAARLARLISLVRDHLDGVLADDVPRERPDSVRNKSTSLQDTVAQVASLAGEIQGVSSSASDGVTTKYDELMIEVKQNCASVSNIMVNLLRQHSPSDYQELRLLLRRLEDTLGNGIARHHWISMSRTIKELSAKNMRLGANRTSSIGEIENSANAAFKSILQLSGNLDAGENRGVNTHDEYRSRQSLAGHMRDLWTKLCGIVEQTKKLLDEQLVFSALHFWTMENRKNLIPKEHENTFSWILNRDKSDFASWLSSGEPLFWISGKPGSGKSTVVKYLAENEKTLELLRAWSGQYKLVTAGFYFWSSAADELQKSGEGLLRSILLQILRQCPDFSSLAFPLQFRQRHNWQPTMDELRQGYRRLLEELPSRGVKLCLFVDGLDEFHGNPLDAIGILDSMMCANEHIKLCISSRPWAEFEIAFGKKHPKLYMHELTKSDMEKYVRDLLRYRDIASPPLVEEFVQKAEGVFLWVFLVVRDTSHLGIEEIQEVLQQKPNTLDEYLAEMICNIEMEQRINTAKTFRAALAAAGKLPLLQYSLLLAAADVETTGQITSESIEDAQSTRMPFIPELEKGLEETSFGLLRSSETSYRHVEFIHRTVADFLNSEAMTSKFHSWCDFDVDQAICTSSLKMLQFSPPSLPEEEENMLSTLHIFMMHARLTSRKAQYHLLSQLEFWLNQLQKRLPRTCLMMTLLGPGNYWAYDTSTHFAFLYYCVSYGLGYFVSQQLKNDKTPFAEPKSALLSGIFSLDPRVRSGLPQVSVEAIEPLLNMGLDCNVPWGDRNLSFWNQLLVSSYSKHLKGLLDQYDQAAIQMTLAHGADLTTPVEVFSGGLTRVSSKEILDIVAKDWAEKSNK